VCLERPIQSPPYICSPQPSQKYGIMASLLFTVTSPSFDFIGKEDGLVSDLSLVAHIDPSRIVVSAIPVGQSATQVIVAVLPPSPFNISIQGSSRVATALLVQQLNTGRLNGSTNLGIVEGEVEFSDETIVLNCSGEWQTQCDAYSEGFVTWMQVVMVVSLVVITLICVYACCCLDSNLFFTYDRPLRPRRSRAHKDSSHKDSSDRKVNDVETVPLKDAEVATPSKTVDDSKFSQ